MNDEDLRMLRKEIQQHHATAKHFWRSRQAHLQKVLLSKGGAQMSDFAPFLIGGLIIGVLFPLFMAYLMERIE